MKNVTNLGGHVWDHNFQTGEWKCRKCKRITPSKNNYRQGCAPINIFDDYTETIEGEVITAQSQPGAELSFVPANTSRKAGGG